uniref:Uncharacterized protein n=1 Tax=Quercus lobata TaxID=97700 RepID=A0A7N2QYB2_QUELO
MLSLAESCTALAKVARDGRGEVIKERWDNILVEGDAKKCFDTLTSDDEAYKWSISCNLLKRECNSAAHVAVKFTLRNRDPLCCNKDNLSGVIDSACKGDCSSVLI